MIDLYNLDKYIINYNEDTEEFILYTPEKDLAEELLKNYTFHIDYALKRHKVYVHKMNKKQTILKKW